MLDARGSVSSEQPNPRTDIGLTTEAKESTEWVKVGIPLRTLQFSVCSVVQYRIQGGVGLRIEIRLFPSLYLTSYLAPCRSVYPDPYLDLRPRLNLNRYLCLYLYLYLMPYPAPHRTLFLNLFLRSNPALLDTL